MKRERKKKRKGLQRNLNKEKTLASGLFITNLSLGILLEISYLGILFEIAAIEDRFGRLFCK